MATVAVELMRTIPGDGHEMAMVNLDDHPDLVCGAVIRLGSEPDKEWTVYSVHRCVKRADGTYDHSACWQ